MQNLKRVDYWATALLLTVVAGAADLIVKHDPIGQSWERQQVQKSLTWMPKNMSIVARTTTPEPWKPWRIHHGKMSISRKTSPSKDQLMAPNPPGLRWCTTAHKQAYSSLSATQSLQQNPKHPACLLCHNRDPASLSDLCTKISPTEQQNATDGQKTLAHEKRELRWHTNVMSRK